MVLCEECRHLSPQSNPFSSALKTVWAYIVQTESKIFEIICMCATVSTGSFKKIIIEVLRVAVLREFFAPNTSKSRSPTADQFCPRFRYFRRKIDIDGHSMVSSYCSLAFTVRFFDERGSLRLMASR